MAVLLFVACIASSVVQKAPEGTSVSQRTLVIDGHGWGHGLGMPQWGARGMAEAGHRFDAILRRYYSGVRFTGVRRGLRMNVLLERAHGLRLTSARSFQIFAGRRRIARVAGASWLRVFVVSGRTALDRSSSAAGPWKRAAVARGTISFVGSGAPFRITRRGGWGLYHGDIRLRRSDVRTARSM